MPVDLEDGRTVLAWSSLAVLLTAVDAMRARFGDPRTGESPAQPEADRSAN